MKNSNKWVLAALLLLLASLAAYNMGLRAEYRTGNYKDPLHNYTALPFKDFTAVDVPAATAVKVKIVRGPFSVRLNKDNAASVRVAQQNGRLVITANFPQQREYWRQQEAVVISCPRLTSVATDALYQVKGRPELGTENGSGNVTVQGFAQDSLALRQNHASRIVLMDNSLGYLQAEVGTGAGSGAALQIASGNRIRAADLDIRHRSELSIDNVAIPALRCHFADSAKATFSGAALKSLVR